MKIAIVDDGVIYTESLGKMIDKYAEEKQLQIEVDKFVDGFAFFDNYEKRAYDAVFLDVIMPGFGGMEIAKLLRRTNKQISIIFVTTSAKSAVMGYKVEALDYMIKPVSYTNLRLVMNKLVRIYDANKNKKIVQIKTESETVFINTEDIIYIESSKHNCVFHTEQGDYTTVLSIGSVEKEYETYNFIRCQKSYIINLAHVKKITTKYVYLDYNNLQIPISRDKKQFLMLKLMLYYGDIL